jgi:hypothetical protein
MALARCNVGRWQFFSIRWRDAGGSLRAHPLGFGPPFDLACHKSLRDINLQSRGAWSRGWTMWTTVRDLGTRVAPRDDSQCTIYLPAARQRMKLKSAGTGYGPEKGGVSRNTMSLETARDPTQDASEQCTRRHYRRRRCSSGPRSRPQELVCCVPRMRPEADPWSSPRCG